MESQLASLSLEEIQLLHRQALATLEKALLEGASWKELRANRALVIELATLIDKRKHPFEKPGLARENRPDSNEKNKP